LRALIYRTGLTVSAESGICYNTAIEPPGDTATGEVLYLSLFRVVAPALPSASPQ
jgi:hypothetical protein